MGISNWSANDAIRACLGYGTGGNAVVSLRVVHVGDTGSPWFSGHKKFAGWDTLMRELTGVDEEGRTALRVSISDGSPDLYDRPGAHTALGLSGEDMANLFLRCVGRGEDGKPVIRLGAVTATLIAALGGGSGSGE